MSDGAGGVKEGFRSQSGIVARIYSHIPKVTSPTGGKIVISKANGGVEESKLTANNITNKTSKIPTPTDEKIGEVKESTLTVGDIINKIPKIANPTGERLVLSKANGEVKESIR